MRPGPSDEQLLRMMQEVGEVEEAVEAIVSPVAVEEPESDLDPCPGCGEPAQDTVTCAVCEMEGCLPRDHWAPGMNDPCLTLCVRCAREIHLGCATDDEAGNPRCPSCHF